jgi:nitroimidazol reductase NimA-like FMN-containing flavoprotein (pyridoxamine 5'-phosphate oxidase superfamily)
MAELTAIARDVITANLYLVLGTADASGTPWVSPVYYTPDGYSTFYWVSSPHARLQRPAARVEAH